MICHLLINLRSPRDGRVRAWGRGRSRLYVLDRKLLERLMSPSPKSQVMFASAFHESVIFSNFWDSYFSSYGE